MLRFFLALSLFLLLLLFLCSCRSPFAMEDPYWWSPLEVPEVKDRFEYDEDGHPIVVWVENYEIELPYAGYAESEDRRRIIELLEANNELLKEIEDDR